MTVVSSLLLVIALIWLIWIASEDFMTFRIPNRHVLGLFLLSLMVAAAQGPAAALPDLAAGALLFGLGFVMWLLRLMGAGDAKLYLPLGILIGWDGLAPFVIFLLLASLLFLALLWWARRFSAGGWGATRRLKEIAAGRAVPYAVPMALAAVLAVLPRLAG